jgi:diacylglycerol kinase (ATP)
MGILLIHEPAAGNAPWPAERLLGLLAGAGFGDAEHRSMSDGDVGEALCRARKLVVAAGGDGTVARTAIALPDRSVPLLILPMGGANNICRAQDAFGEIEALVRGARDASTTPLGVGEARGRWGVRCFVEAVGLGAVARTTAALQDAKLEADRKSKIGRAALRETVSTLEPIRALITIDGEPFTTPCLLFEVMNIATIGPNLALGPSGQPHDGAFSVVWLPVEGREPFLEWLDDPRGQAPLPWRRARTVTVEAPDEPLRIDDKTVEWDGSRMELRLEPEPVRVMTMGGAP